MSTPAPLAWTEIRVPVPLGWHELVAEALALGPCTSTILGATSIASAPPPEGHEYVRTFVPSSEDGDALRARVRAALDDLARRSEVPELEGLTVDYRPLPPEDYASSWKKTWKPFRLGRLVFLPPWDPRADDPDALRAGESRLVIAPGGSFGSGRHATTRTCLRVVQERVEPGQRVLDAGSGSGVLSVACALLGAREVLGFDLDPVAEAAANELARDNGVADACTFRTGDFACLDDADSGADRGFDGVLANIYSDVVQAHAAELFARLRPGGWFAFSGCPAHHRAATRDAIVANGFDLQEERTRGRWTTFVGVRPGTA